MAKFTPFLGNLSGKLKGIVFAFNKAGSYVRGFRPPTDPATPAQLNNRAVFATAVTQWHSLTNVMKGLWNAYAVSDFKAKWPKSGVLYSGYNAFVSLYNAAKNGIEKANDVAFSFPVAANADSLEFITLSATPPGSFSGSVQAPAGVPLGFQITACDLILTGSTCGLTFVFDRSVGTGVTPAGPIMRDAIGDVPMGFQVVASLPVTQENMFIENPDINLVAIFKPLDTISDWSIGNTMTITTTFVPEFYTRKNTYTGGDIVQCKVYALGQNGQTVPVGTVFTTVTV